MLNVIVRNLGDLTIFHCAGRILSGDNTLHSAARSYANSATLVLDLAHVDDIDAGGLGVLLEVRKWTEANGIQLRLVNVTSSVREVLEFTHLSDVFKICSAEEIFLLPDRRGPATLSKGRFDRSGREEEGSHGQNI